VGGTNDDPIITWSDWMTSASSLDRTDTATTGGTLPLHCVRLQIPSTVTNRSAWYYTDLNTGWVDENIDTAPYGRILRQREQAVLAATQATAASFTSTTNISAGVPFMVQYVPRLRTAMTVAVLGNSIQEGAGATIRNFGWSREMQAAISTLSRPVEVCNIAVGSSGATVDEQRAVRLLESIQPSVVVAHLFNINNVGTGTTILASEIDTMRQRYAAVRAECARLGIPLISVTGLPGTTATWPFGATDSLRRSLNAELLAFGASSRVPVVDFATVLEGPDDGTGMLQLAAAYSADGTHPNTAGYRAMAAVAAPVINSLRR
jgi:lysophospholipase L1-like esterase